LIDPLARISKRFEALFFVFIFGIVGRPFFDVGRRSLRRLRGPPSLVMAGAFAPASCCTDRLVFK
jgi:hypothetical protein